VVGKCTRCRRRISVRYAMPATGAGSHSTSADNGCATARHLLRQRGLGCLQARWRDPNGLRVGPEVGLVEGGGLGREQVNCLGLLLGMQAAVPLLEKADQPAIVNNLSNVSAVLPGPVDTPMHDARTIERLRGATLLGRTRPGQQRIMTVGRRIASCAPRWRHNRLGSGWRAPCPGPAPGAVQPCPARSRRCRTAKARTRSTRPGRAAR
jgi:hypothetical protein